MPNWTKLAAGWAFAALIAIAFSWGAVSQVRNRVIQPTIEIPTTAVIAASISEPDAGPAISTTAPRVIRLEPEVVEDGTTTSTTAANGAGTPGNNTTTSTTTTTSPPPGATSTTGPPTTSTTTTLPPAATTTTTTTTTIPLQTETATYDLVGGVVTISFSPGVVNWVSSFPHGGYSTEVKHAGPNEVRVRFESDDHTSDFRAEWEGGELKITLDETGQG